MSAKRILIRLIYVFETKKNFIIVFRERIMSWNDITRILTNYFPVFDPLCLIFVNVYTVKQIIGLLDMKMQEMEFSLEDKREGMLTGLIFL